MRYVTWMLLLGVLVAGLSSCGGSNSGGTLTPTIVSIDSDVATWTGTPGASTYTVKPDIVNVTLNAFPAPPGSTGTTGEKVVIKSATIIYTPANTISPPLPTQFMTLTGQMVELGNSLPVPVTVASQALKSTPPLSSLVRPNTGIYSYYATITFACDYLIANNNPFSISSQININFADFAN